MTETEKGVTIKCRKTTKEVTRIRYIGTDQVSKLISVGKSLWQSAEVIAFVPESARAQEKCLHLFMKQIHIFDIFLENL